MFTVFQIPIVDSRIFFPGNTHRAAKPTWPVPEVGQHFVRQFGTVEWRPRGGLAAFSGEEVYCRSRKAIRLAENPGFALGGRMRADRTACLHRRFYFDGRNVGKLEVSFGRLPNAREPFKWNDWIRSVALSKHFIGLQEQNNRSTIELMAAGRHLAALYLRSTTLSAGRNATTPWWVTPGTPAMILEFQWQGMPELPKGARQAIVPAISTTVHFQRVALKGQRINVWYLGSTISDPRDRELRELRILLLRFHAELESIKVVLRLIMEEKLQLKRGEKGSDEFQAYLHEAITLLSKLDRIGHSQRGLLEAVQGCFDEMNLGERASLLRKLQWIRGNLLHTLTQKAREFQYAGNNITIIEHMGDKYENSGMAANMGPDGQVHGNTFNQQVWNGLQGTTDLAKLAEDLVKLKAAMEGEARESEHRMAVGAVDAAQQAAREGNGPKVVEYLKMAGKWAYGIAEKIGVSVAAQVLKGTLGL